MKAAIAIALLALTACGGSKSRPDEVTASGPITLNLAWPADMSGTMQLYGATEKDGGATELNVTYTLATSATSQGVALKYSDARDISVPNIPEPQKKLLVPMIQAVPTVVMNDGAIVAIEGFEEFAGMLNELMAPAYQELPGLKEQMGAMMTADFFLASAQQEWEWRGTAWHGRTMTVGQPVEEEAELALAFAPGTVKGKVVMTLVGVEPCPNNASTQCVRLERKLELDSAAIRAALPAEIAGAFDSFEAQRSIVTELIAEPATLRPHRFSKIESTSFEAKRGEERQTQYERKQTLEQYTWQ